MFASLHTAQLTYRQVQKSGFIDRIAARVRHANAAYEQRQHLANLDDSALADIGLTRDQAASEAARPVWDLPASR